MRPQSPDEIEQRVSLRRSRVLFAPKRRSDATRCFDQASVTQSQRRTETRGLDRRFVTGNNVCVQVAPLHGWTGRSSPNPLRTG